MTATTASLVAFAVALWCVFAPSIAFKRGQRLGERIAVRRLLPVLQDAQRLLGEYRALLESLLTESKPAPKPTEPAHD